MAGTDPSSGAHRRDFLKTVALAGTAAEVRAQEAASGAGAATAARKAPAAAGMEYPRKFTGRQLAMIAFPLGGVGAGSVALGGRGQLQDWEIFNRPGLGKFVSYAFPAIRVQTGSGKPVSHVAEARLMPPYETIGGLSPSQVSGLTRLEGATFSGEYPIAHIDFHDRELPVRVALDAFTPVIPLDADASGLPIAILRYTVTNPGREVANVSMAYSLDNPVGSGANGKRHPSSVRDARVNKFRAEGGLSGLVMTNPAIEADDSSQGSFVLGVIGANESELSYLTGWPKAKWWASALLFWDDFTSDGRLGPAGDGNTVGSVCVQREIPAGGRSEFTFLLAWHFPNRTPAWCGWGGSSEAERNAIIGNYYSTRFADAWEAASYTAKNLPSLESRTRRFVAAMRESTLPAAVKDAAVANISTLATPTCFRTADGKFRGFEGITADSGCCHGSCTHVWNYETTTQHLFPELARSMREAAFELADRLDGILPIRLSLPEGTQKGGTTAADGTMGQIIKAYMDWQMLGDDRWLAAIWPRVRKTLEFAWVEGGWDADRDGVMEGVQHNTYDVEFYGPNPMCGVYYLGALRAAEEMARASGDTAFADECSRLFRNGSHWIDANLFNGEHYVQQIRGIPTEKIAPPLRSTGGAEDPEHPDFQMGEGCLTDQLIGQYLADVAGLGPLLDPAKIEKALAAIYKYNHRQSLSHHDSVERIYALNDEAATLLCDYAEGKRPRIPFPYASEAWTGIEYPYATQLLYGGRLREGIGAFEEVRRRYDGERRNPWDEPECGRHYARAMSAWSGIVALSGFRYRGHEKAVVATPRQPAAQFASFWSTGTGWGMFRQSRGSRPRFVLEVVEGSLPCRSVELALTFPAGSRRAAELDGRALAADFEKTNSLSVFRFAEMIRIPAGGRLTLS
ncbi:MAG: non-lysosomal glucosylceramidase [Bryobacterales bacterium]|nr:non-lysosomal glucosylceramidase [Bryobacterales bacterium]